MALPGGALHGESAKLRGSRLENSGDRVTHVHRSEKFRVKLGSIDPAFVQDSVIPGRVAGLPRQSLGNAWVHRCIMVEVGNLAGRRNAEAEEFQMGQRATVDNF